MPANTQTNIGALFKNERRTNTRSPVLTGILELDAELVAYLSQKLWSRKPAKLSLAAWKNNSKAGESYFTIKAQKEYIHPDADEPNDLPDEGLDL